LLIQPEQPQFHDLVPLRQGVPNGGLVRSMVLQAALHLKSEIKARHLEEPWDVRGDPASELLGDGQLLRCGDLGPRTRSYLPLLSRFHLSLMEKLFFLSVSLVRLGITELRSGDNWVALLARLYPFEEMG
jgi:hypothetical protein